jgi:hypothetical protein
MKALTLFAIVLVPPLLPQDENQSTTSYAVVANVQYCTGAGKPLLMDVFMPRQEWINRRRQSCGSTEAAGNAVTRMAARELNSWRRQVL